uniref:RRM domain-containing protein n=1 Tax=Ciona savignyi TaxID=51511 RepID=H2YA27_CIOSA
MVVSTKETEETKVRGRARQRKARSSSSSGSSSGSSSSGSSSDGSRSSSSDSSSSSSSEPARGRGKQRERKDGSPQRRKPPADAGNKRSRSPRRPIRRERSPTPKPTKLHIGNLTKNINKEHVTEIFSYYGKVKSVDMPMERNGLPRGLAYVEFDDHTEAEKALKYMNGGQIDGQVVTLRSVLPIRRRPQRRPSPPMMQRGGPRGFQGAWRRSPPRRRRPPVSPPRR